MASPIKLMLVAGARPNFMKIAPVIREIQRRPDEFLHSLVHTGQHYDEGMSDVFFRDLAIPRPDYHLSVGSGSHAQQTAAIMVAFEPALLEYRPDCVLVFGDVNSTLACSIVAKKLNVAVAHVEAGLRSGDRSMPEEINRIVTDSISDYFFVTEPSGVQHLTQEGKEDKKIHHVGHVMIDNLFFEVQRLDRQLITTPYSDELRLKSEKYGVVTMHRPSNVDDESVFRGIVEALENIAKKLPLIFPMHPRTRERAKRFGVEFSQNITVSDPLGYSEFLNLWRNASLVLTDSGGLQEETTGLGIPCLTLRENTERPITVDDGTNRVVGVDPENIFSTAVDMLNQPAASFNKKRPKFWDGRASERILDVLANAFKS